LPRKDEKAVCSDSSHSLEVLAIALFFNLNPLVSISYFKIQPYMKTAPQSGKQKGKLSEGKLLEGEARKESF
jgi:hypothetical protein